MNQRNKLKQLENGKVVKMCVEKFHKNDLAHLKNLKDISKSPQHYEKLSAAFYTAKLWPNKSIIKVAFMGTPEYIPRTPLTELQAIRDAHGDALKLDPLQFEISKNNTDVITAIKQIVNERINPIMNLQYVFIDDLKDAHIRVSFDASQGAWALVGTDCLANTDITQPTMNLGWFDVGTTCHEFLHTAGLIHEHQNPSGKAIDWNVDKVYQWAEDTQGWDKETTYRNIIEKYATNQINGSSFDPNSIMLYFFPGNLTNDGVGTHQNLILSPVDVEYINSVYANAPEKAQDFYKKVYGVDIPDSVHLNAMRSGRGKQKDDESWEIIKALLWGIGICLVIFILARYLLPKFY